MNHSYANPSLLHFMLVFVPLNCVTMALYFYLKARSPSTILATLLSLYSLGLHDIVLDGGNRVCTFRCGLPWARTRTHPFDDLAGVWVSGRDIGVKFKDEGRGLRLDSLKNSADASAMADRVSEATGLPLITRQRHKSGK